MRVDRRMGLLLLGLALLGVPSAPAGAELDPEAWREATRGLTRLMRAPGQREEKRERAEALGRDDSERAARLIVTWALTANKRRRGPLLEAVSSAEKRLAAYRRKVERRHGRRGGGWTTPEREELAKRERAHAAAVDAWGTEADVDRHLLEALRAHRAASAWAWTFAEGVPRLLAAGYDGSLYRAVLEAATERASPRAHDAALALVRERTPPAVRIRGIDWAASARPTGAFEAVCVALADPVVAVRRAVVRALAALDDPRAVEVLIPALARADGLLGEEIDAVLGRFTGLRLAADARAWARWWAENGERYKAAERREAVERRPRPEDASFYGITSASTRILFVLDQSGSMQKPARGLDAQTGEPRPGGSRMAAALEELRRAIGNLAADVRFNILFYSDGTRAWKPVPELPLATKANKAAAVRWLEQVDAEGTTALFAALHQALAYADDFQGGAGYDHPGVDTVFLLTDGSPTDASGNDLTPRELDGALLRFLAANEVHRIVVNTVGVGRGHNRMLMERIANKTGGRYVAVVLD